MFEAWDLLNPTRPLDPSLQILLAGLKLESPVAAQWWCENYEVLKKMGSWADFATAVKDHFVPASWRLDSLACFYAISQCSSKSFADFLARLQSARSALSGAGCGFTINDSVMKNHLLFNCNCILSLHICTIPTLDYASLKVDGLIGLMSSTWNSMVAENIGSARAMPQPGPPLLSRGLSEAEWDAIHIARGCFNCQKMPSSPGWIPHNSCNCPGDKSRGIPPHMVSAPQSINAVTPNSTASSTKSPPVNDNNHNARNEADILAVLPSSQKYVWDNDPHINNVLMAILPSCVLGNGTDSEGDSDEDWMMLSFWNLFYFYFFYYFFWPSMDFPSRSYDTLFLNLWPLIAGVLLSWHCGLVNVQDSSDMCYLFFFFFAGHPFFLCPLLSFLELGRV